MQAIVAIMISVGWIVSGLAAANFRARREGVTTPLDYWSTVAAGPLALLSELYIRRR